MNNYKPFDITLAEQRLILRLRLLTKGAHLCTIVKGTKADIDTLIIWNEGRKVENLKDSKVDERDGSGGAAFA